MDEAGKVAQDGSGDHPVGAGANSSSNLLAPIDAESEITEIESMCMNCHKDGVTRMMLTKIPFYRDVVVSSFECPYCNFRNSELNSVLEISEMGVEWTLNVKDKQDLNRLVVKTEHAVVSIPAIEFETVANTQKGELTTVEGVLRRFIDGLQQDQETRRTMYPDLAEKIDAFIKKIEDCIQLKMEFTMLIRDISGNSFVGARSDTPAKDPNLTSKKFTRSKAEDEQLGVAPPEDEPVEREPNLDVFYKEEVVKLPSRCPQCYVPCEVNMAVTQIPNFKEVVIMATNCDKCGYRSNEVKSGGGIEPFGKKVALTITCLEDLKRDLIKSDTCMIEIPELEINSGAGTIVSKYTTVEGLLSDMKKHFSEDNPFVSGDSADPSVREKLLELCSKMEGVMSGKHKCTLILDDPAGNSWIQGLDGADPNLVVTEYKRTFEQNDDLGLNDMKVDDCT